MILLTGSSGFLGQYILKVLGKENVKTLGRGISDIVANLKSEVPAFHDNFTMVIHAAGKAHTVPKTDMEKQEFFDVNVQGTLNLLAGLHNSQSLPHAFIFISSVAVYGKETGLNIDEKSPLLAEDPYGRSKIDAELCVIDWCNRNFVKCTILRLPLIAGAKPPGNLKAMINGIKSGYYVNIGGGDAQKSIVLAEDVAKIIPIVAEIGGTFNLTDRHHPRFSELSAVIAKQLNKKKPFSIPLPIAKLLAAIGDFVGVKSPFNSKKLHKITSDLTFNDDTAVAILNWNPTPVLTGFVIE
jgi:nucleoside-diphosphate-sugar epimerase